MVQKVKLGILDAYVCKNIYIKKNSLYCLFFQKIEISNNRNFTFSRKLL